MQHEAKVHTTKPKDFPPEIQVAACYVEIDRQVLLLQCSPDKPEPGKWGVPAGKVEKGETPEQAAKRELFEETGISVQMCHIKPRGPLYIRKPRVAFAFHLFQIQLAQKPQVQISNEHSAYIWASKEDLVTLPLMEGALKALQYYRISVRQGKIYSQEGLI